MAAPYFYTKYEYISAFNPVMIFRNSIFDAGSSFTVNTVDLSEYSFK